MQTDANSPPFGPRPRRATVAVTIGDGSTSEGEFWEALNAATTLRLPVLFVVQDNGYAISVPVEVNTAGGSISKLVRRFFVASSRLPRTAS